ncbi:MAG: DNA repair protein RadC [Ruminococcaceae bacterium]|nr:DNA repair protein RadC [Oscillospiraceae bacterium]
MEKDKKAPKKQASRSPHEGHRARMRQRFLEGGADLFADHELLEMLLYYTNRRGDTNETAHSLIENFGSLDEVLEALPEDLASLFGIGESTAFFLALVGAVTRRYTKEKLSPVTERTVYDTEDKIISLLLRLFLGSKAEQVVALLFDNGMHLIDCLHLGSGTVSTIHLSARRIAERAFSKHASSVVLAHNHPSGISTPSGEDIRFTQRLREALELLEISLLEHFILTEGSYSTVLNPFVTSLEDRRLASPIVHKLHRGKEDREQRK